MQLCVCQGVQRHGAYAAGCVCVRVCLFLGAWLSFPWELQSSGSHAIKKKKGKKQKVLSYWKHKFALTLKKYRGVEQ